MTPAASQSAAVVACRQCRRENPAGRRFCGGCGQPLWEKCPRCGAECAGDERFCGGCGADVAESLEEQRKQCEVRIQEALSLAKAHQYDAAFSTLQSVA